MCTSVKPATAGMGLTGRGTGMAVGTENCILICTQGTPTCYDSLSLPPLHFISIGYTFPIPFKSPFTISITKHFSLLLSLSITQLFIIQPFYYSALYYSALYYSALYYSALYYSAFSLFSSITQRHLY